MNDSALSVRDLQVRFPSEDGLVHAVSGVSFDLKKGEVLGVVGESGCGKSVTSLAVMGLLPKSAQVSGSVSLGGTEMIGLYPSEMRSIRGRRISMIFQDPMTALNPVYTVGFQLVEAVRAHQSVTKRAAKDRAIELLDVVGIPNPSSRFDAYPHEFSGGMRQRAVIAIAIANEPEVLIADEPTTALDVTVQAQILDTLLRIRSRTGTAMLFITHDLGVMAGVADRLLVMYAGKVVESGTVEQVFYDPQMPYTIGLLGAIPGAQMLGHRLNQIKGAPPSLLGERAGCAFAPRCPISHESCFTTAVPAMFLSEDHGVACHRRDVVLGLSDRRRMFEEEVLR